MGWGGAINLSLITTNVVVVVVVVVVLVVVNTKAFSFHNRIQTGDIILHNRTVFDFQVKS